MVYSLASLLCGVRTPIVHTYDINCQYWPLLQERFDDLPPALRQEVQVPPKDWQHLIPKMHLMGHIQKCQAPFSLNFAHGAAWTCGKAIKWMWSMTNGLAPSVREMNPGMRMDYIDSHMGFHNHCKVTHDGMSHLPSLVTLAVNYD
jgi:hypothetical protein